MSIWHLTVNAQTSSARWIAVTLAALAAWILVYSQLVPFSDWVVTLLPVTAGSSLAELIRFFVYDTPKVLMLLALIVFAMGVVRSFFSPERRAPCSPAGAKASAMSWRRCSES